MGNGEPVIEVRAPLVELIENTEILFVPALATNKKLPAESMASNIGVVPTAGRGVTSVSAPLLEIVNSDTSLSPEFATYKNFFDG